MKPTFTLQPNEKILLELQPDRRLILCWLLQRWMYWAMIAVFSYIVFATGLWQPGTDPRAAAIIITSLVIALTALWLEIMRHWHWYIITNQRCIVYAGFITLQKRLIPRDRIVDIDMHQTLLQRILRIGSIRLSIPSISINGNSITTLSGLPVSTCEQLMDSLLAPPK